MGKTIQGCGGCSQNCAQTNTFIEILPEGIRERLAEQAVRKKIPAGGEVFVRGGESGSIYVVLDGKVKLTRCDADGKEQIAGIFSKGEIIWEGVLSSKGSFPYSCVCITRSCICTIRRQDVSEILSEPRTALGMMAILSNKLHDANMRSLILSTADPKARLAAFLLYHMEREAERIVRLKLDDIAGSLNLRPETVSRKIRELTEDGYIRRVGRSGIELLDTEGLSALIP